MIVNHNNLISLLPSHSLSGANTITVSTTDHRGLWLELQTPKLFWYWFKKLKEKQSQWIYTIIHNSLKNVREIWRKYFCQSPVLVHSRTGSPTITWHMDTRPLGTWWSDTQHSVRARARVLFLSFSAVIFQLSPRSAGRQPTHNSPHTGRCKVRKGDRNHFYMYAWKASIIIINRMISIIASKILCRPSLTKHP